MKTAFSILGSLIITSFCFGQKDQNLRTTHRAKYLDMKPEYQYVQAYKKHQDFNDSIQIDFLHTDTVTLLIPIYSTYGLSTIYRIDNRNKQKVFELSEDYGFLLEIPIHKEHGDSLEMHFDGCWSNSQISIRTNASCFK